MRWKLGNHNYFQCQYFVLFYFYLKPYCMYQLSHQKLSQCCSYNYFIVMLCILCNNKQSVSLYLQIHSLYLYCICIVWCSNSVGTALISKNYLTLICHYLIFPKENSLDAQEMRDLVEQCFSRLTYVSILRLRYILSISSAH